MVDTIVFHLGDRKTGSTSIQHTLAQRGWNCDAVPLFYPNQLNQIPLAKSLSDPLQFKHRQNRFSKLEKRMERSAADVGVVSAEDFESVPPECLKEALEAYLPGFASEARLIAYVRPHADRVVSSWAQQVKMGLFTGSLSDFHDLSLEKKRFQYHSRFSAWRDVFGAQFTLRPMIRNQLHKDSVVQDFFHFALQTDDFTLTEAKSNESISLEDMAMLRVFHDTYLRNHPYSKLQANIGGVMAQLLTTLPKRSTTTKTRLDKMMVPGMIAAYQDDAQALDTDFFDGTPMLDALQGAADRAVDTAPSILPEDHFDTDELRSIQAMSELLAVIIDEQGDDLRKHLRGVIEDGVLNTAPGGQKAKGKKHKKRQHQDTLTETDINQDLFDLF